MDMWCFYFVSSWAVTKHFGNWIMKNLLWNTFQNLPLIACKPRQEKNVKTFDRTFGEGEGEGEIKRGHVAASSAWVKKRQAEWHCIQVKWVSKCNDQWKGKERKGTFFSQSTMIHHIVSKNSLWYGELYFLPRWTWLYIRCVLRPDSEARWHFVLVFFFDETCLFHD